MDLNTTLLGTGNFIESADKMPNWPKFVLLLAFLATLLGCYGLKQLPAILHEAPPAIHALREHPGRPLPENYADSAEGQRNR
jgi:hypothetical protein